MANIRVRIEEAKNYSGERKGRKSRDDAGDSVGEYQFIPYNEAIFIPYKYKNYNKLLRIKLN